MSQISAHRILRYTTIVAGLMFMLVSFGKVSVAHHKPDTVVEQSGSESTTSTDLTHVVRGSIPPLSTHGPTIYLSDPQPLSSDTTSEQPTEGKLEIGASPLSMAKADIDGDGVDDLVIGYGTASGGSIVIYRGNVDAYAAAE